MIRCYDKLMVHDELTLDEIDGIWVVRRE